MDESKSKHEVKSKKTSQAHLFNLAPSKSTREGKCHVTKRSLNESEAIVRGAVNSGSKCVRDAVNSGKKRSNRDFS